MLNEPISKVIPKMAVPTIVAFLITSIYNLADTYFVSFLGTNATAAVSVNASLDQIIMMAGSLLAIGANSYIARLLGARDKDKANRVFSTAFFLAASFGLIVLAIGTTFIYPVVCSVLPKAVKATLFNMRPMSFSWHLSWQAVLL